MPKKLNILLSAVVLLVILVYVIISNALISQKYLLNSLRAEFSRASIQSAGANSEKNIESLIHFAENAGMIEAKDTATILMDSGFALDQ